MFNSSLIPVSVPIVKCASHFSEEITTENDQSKIMT